MAECDCGAETEGKWADKHTAGCASLGDFLLQGLNGDLLRIHMTEESMVITTTGRVIIGDRSEAKNLRDWLTCQLDEPNEFEQAEDETGGPCFFWQNPWSGQREKIANLWWPQHPPEETATIEKLFENLALVRRDFE